MSKELLTEILESVHALHFFLSRELTTERLSRENELKRQKHASDLDAIMTRIRSTHPSIRPRIDIPSRIAQPAVGKKPPPPPPTDPAVEQEMYVECEPVEDGDRQVEDYLEFEPGQGAQDGPTSMYEDMQASEGHDVEQDLYEEPVVSKPPTPGLEDQPGGVYEEPELSPPGGPPSFKPPTPPSSQENNGSGTIYTEAKRPGIAASISGSELSNLPVPPSMDWDYDELSPKGEKLKVSELKEVGRKGYLEKLGGRSKSSWQKRFCALAGHFMYFYEKESSKTYNNRVALPSYVVNPVPEYTVPKKKQFAFKLSHTDSAGKKKDYMFRATTDDDRQKWIQVIKSVLQQAATASPSRFTMTLPHMSSHQVPTVAWVEPKPRSASFGDGQLYEELTIEEEPQDEYVAVSPTPEDGPDEEYVDVQPAQGEDIQQEQYEEPSSLQPPPPTKPPPPSSRPPTSKLPPPSQPPPSFQPPPPSQPPPSSHTSLRPDPIIDTTKVYSQHENGIRYDNVFVALWDFSAGDRDELNLKRGDLVYVHEPKKGADWWFGELMDERASSKLGVSGLFPATFATSAFEVLPSNE